LIELQVVLSKFSGISIETSNEMVVSERLKVVESLNRLAQEEEKQSRSEIPNPNVPVSGIARMY